MLVTVRLTDIFQLHSTKYVWEFVVRSLESLDLSSKAPVALFYL